MFSYPFVVVAIVGQCLDGLLSNGCFNECQKEWVWCQGCAAILGVELAADVPFVSWYFHNLNKTSIWVCASGNHASSLKVGQEF